MERDALPWALVAHAGEVAVGERARLADSLRELADLHRRWTLLATCHRVELYGFGPRPAGESMRLLEGEPAVRHLFRVAAGLESAVVGETEILGQVRNALSHARERGTDERVARLFECAIAVGRGARASLPERDGLAGRAVAWLARRTHLAGRGVLVVGLGPMGRAMAAAAEASGAVVTVASRRPRPETLDLAAAARVAPEMAAVAVAIRAEWAELAAAGQAPADSRLPPVADLSAPPAVPAAVRLALGPDYLGIDDLWERGRADTGWVRKADAVVADGVAEYLGWLEGRGSVATLVALRDRAESRRRARVERLLRRLPDLDERARGLVVAMSKQLVTDVLHEPVCALRSDRDGRHGEAARALFEL
ncbi:MAG TPA: hypothetical protein VKF59_13845 [Candidatus Dormibacteraeota bacterium]|nr:hypothetical protein [Candidatus Dormibacteraeota bacterium]